jgi:hypothetical protein
MTGRAAGHCSGYSVPGYMNPVPGRGFGRGGWGRGWGRGFGRGRGWGRGFGWGSYPAGAPYGPYAPAYVPAYAPSYGPEDEVTALKDQAKYFEEALQEVKKRIDEIESSAEKE